MMASNGNYKNSVKIEPILGINVDSKIGHCRAVPVNLGKGRPRAFLAVYHACFGVDPFTEMFFFPTDTIKFILVTEKGEVLWKKDLGPAVVPGTYFCPIASFDLDGDGVDEIWFVNNLDPKHPLGISNYRLERLDAFTGQTMGQIIWPDSRENQSLSATFRNFIFGGFVRGEPVLVTAQGTYHSMFLQGWNSDLSSRWKLCIDKNEPGARGSHMYPVVDMNRDGIDEIMWGERCIELDKGTELFCADRDRYRGHSDVIQPIFDSKSGHWFLYTCRESDPGATPRVILYDEKGEYVWGQIEHGHIDMGWVARLGDNREYIASAIRIGKKTCGPDGRFHKGCEEFAFNLFTGEAYSLPFSTYLTIPVDINGDGYHELAYCSSGGSGKVLDRHGNLLADVGAPAAICGNLVSHPGEQLLCYYPDGMLRIWADLNAEDTKENSERYNHSFYRLNMQSGCFRATSGI